MLDICFEVLYIITRAWETEPRRPEKRSGSARREPEKSGAWKGVRLEKSRKSESAAEYRKQRENRKGTKETRRENGNGKERKKPKGSEGKRKERRETKGKGNHLRMQARAKQPGKRTGPREEAGKRRDEKSEARAEDLRCLTVGESTSGEGTRRGKR